jgi:hypothetical protein
MEAIIQQALDQLKGRIVEIAGQFERSNLTPRTLSDFEHELHQSLGELGRRIEIAILERSDIERDVIDHGGSRHYFKYKGPQEYQCLFGKIEVRRSVYQANGERTLCPLEVNAGIFHHHLTPPAAEFVSYSTAHMVPGEVGEFCRRWQYLTPSETVIKHVAAGVGELSELVADIYEEKIHEKEEAPPEGTSVVTISRDGTCVNIRSEGWREAQCGAISFYGDVFEDEEGKQHRERLHSMYMGQMPEERTPTFNEKFDREVERVTTMLSRRTTVVCIADGSVSIWKYFENHTKLKNVVHINDFYHAAEHLSDVAAALFGRGTAEAKRWYKKNRRILKKQDGGVEQTIRSIRYYRASLNIRSASRLEEIRKALRYFTRNRKRMNYAQYRRQGLPIGSGVVEASCKTLIGHRLKRAGMRWSIDGGQSILNLRSVLLSKRWDFFWASHQDVIGADPVAA